MSSHNNFLSFLQSNWQPANLTRHSTLSQLWTEQTSKQPSGPKIQSNNDKVPRFKRVQTCLTAYEVFSWYIRQIYSKYMQVYDFICTLKRLPDYLYLFTPEEHVQKRSFPLTGVCMVRLDLFRRFPPPTCAKDGSAAKLYKTKSSRLLTFQARGGLKWL